MSSSDRLTRPRLPQLDKEQPAARRDDFTTRASFERAVPQRAAPLSADDAYKNGLVEGERRGREAALKELEPARQQLQVLARALADARGERLAQAERELADVASEIARRILRGELQQGGDVVVRLARSCVAAATPEGAAMTLHVAPADFDLIRAHLPELESELADVALRVIPDGKIVAGNVVLETERRCYEGRAERLLDAGVQSKRAKEGAQ